ncbi:hypothetical protein CONLIGDRAFT_641324 [Coniochaeta ligniaria NRRL 30616]|uniref:Uncharacterized protein n=1 Tax=Coniochaeta ligniaria NRRL 30616 TaxID=1408157 RepID=A0A1J7JQ97_9PEZI|nr:hypothetical protein CONLIGDRAFT_641324 [Coniochaeta ligniaria NRRL 30616]
MSGKIQQWMEQQGRLSLTQKQQLWEKKVALYAAMKKMRNQIRDGVVDFFKTDDTSGKVWSEVLGQAQERKEKKGDGSEETRDREQAVEEKDAEQSKGTRRPGRDQRRGQSQGD